MSLARNVIVLVSFTVGACTTGSKPETTENRRLPGTEAAKISASSSQAAQLPPSLPNWQQPFAGFLNLQDDASARCLLVVDSTANGNSLMMTRNEATPQGIFDGLKSSEQRRLLAKAWTVIPLENSLYGARAVQSWAATQNYPGVPHDYDDLRPEDQVRYLKDVVDLNYRKLYRVQVIRLLSRPSELHKAFYSPTHKWKTDKLGLFITKETSESSEQPIYRVGLVDFKDDPRWAWPRAESFSDSIKFEKTSQLQKPDWERLAQLESGARSPAAISDVTKGAERDRIEIAIHLSQVENFISFLPQCAPEN